MKKILFVCMGNICRSPTGEGVLQKLIEDRKLTSSVKVDSAGTIGFHAGKPADHRMRQVASAKGYRLESIARQVTRRDFDLFDLIVAMDRDNLADLKRLEDSGSDRDGSNVSKIRLLSDFLGDEWPTDVPDPYYGGPDGFIYVMEMVEAACPKILDELNCGPG